jgi:DNA replication protein DnaC
MAAMSSDNTEFARSVIGNFNSNEYKTAKCDIHGEYQSRVMKFGSVTRCTPCLDCFEIQVKEQEKRDTLQREAEYLERAAQNKIDAMERKIGNALIPKRFKGKTFEQYIVESPEQQKALDACKEYAFNFDEHYAVGRCLILFGNPGTGKTHLAASIADYLVTETKHTAIYRSLFSILQAIKNTYGNDAESTEREIFETLESPSLLIIDEIGATKSTEFELATLFALINARYEAQVPTLIISNLDAKDLAGAIGDRCVDRLREGGGRALRFGWDSMRSNLKGGSL